MATTTNGDTTNTDKNMEAIRNDMSRLRDDLSQALRSLMGDEKSFIRDKASVLAEKTKDVSKRAIAVTENQIKERPFLSILVVFLIGLVLGKIFDQRFLKG